MSDSLVYVDKREDGVAYVVLNAPKKKNAMARPMMIELHQHLLEVDNDPEIRCVILKGEGGCFCSGGDLSGMAAGGGGDQTIEDKRASITDFGKCISVIARSEKPFIAQVEGYAMGGGFSLALACDMIFAGESAKMSSNFTHVGLAPEMGAMLFLPQAIGMYKAKELWYSARKVTGTEGYDLGFVSRVYPDAELAEATLAMAKHIAELPTSPLGIMKRTTNSHVYSDLDAILTADAQNSPLCLQSKECLEYLMSNFKKK